MGELALIVTSTAKDGKRDEIRGLYEELMAPRAVDNPSQEVVVWCADQHDPNTFYLFEIYTDAAAMGANAQADWFGEYMARVGPLLAGEPTVAMATPMWTKGV
ncbi:MAG: antibiotic biosynthesis monooxygenase [Acidimicrobiia bacterium]|jgi:quinol monooxygenase YgiN